MVVGTPHTGNEGGNKDGIICTRSTIVRKLESGIPLIWVHGTIIISNEALLGI